MYVFLKMLCFIYLIIYSFDLTNLKYRIRFFERFVKTHHLKNLILDEEIKC